MKTPITHQKKDQKSKHHSYLIMSLLLTIVLTCSIFTGCSSSKQTTANADVNETTEATQEVTTQEVTTSHPQTQIDLMMIGDILAHEGVYKSGLQPDGNYNYDHLFAHILPDIQSSDLRIVNQETILGGVELGLSGYPCFNSPYELGDAEVKAGFNVILHATNHTIDKGLTGVENCLNFWQTKHPETTVLGINKDKTSYDNINVYNKDGFKVALLNYTYGTNGIAIPSSNPYCVNLLDKDKITADVAKAKQMADMVIVFPHWGTEYVYTPDDSQKMWTNLFLDLGVDVVIGAHPHVVEPVELLTSSTGHQMLVYYSLGNFVSNQDQKPRMVGGMAKVSLVKDTDGTCYIKQYSLEPLVTQKLFGTSLITTYKLTDYTEDLAQKNAIRKDSGCSDFSLLYCENLAKQILGDTYDPATKSIQVQLHK